MKDEDKTKEQLLAELANLRQRLASANRRASELGPVEAERVRSEKERARTEEQLRRAQREWEGIFQAIGHPTLILDARHNVIAANRVAVEATGKRVEDILGQKCYEIFHSSDRPPKGCPLGKMLLSGRLESVEMEVEALGGAFLVSCTPVFDERGDLEKVIHIATDITERVRSEEERARAEEALRESEQFLQNVFDAIQDGISVLDTDLTVIRTNRWMEQMYAHQMPLAGRKCYQAYQQRRSACPWCPTLQTIETGETHTEIVPYPSTEDPKGWIELSTFPVKDAQGRVTNVIEYVKDITERVRSEEERARAEVGLQQRAQRLEILHTIDQAILEARLPEETAHAALRRLRQLVPCIGVGIATFDLEAQEAALFAVDADFEVGLETGMHLPLQGIVDVEALQQGQVLVEEDLQAIARPPASLQALQKAGIGSYVAAPLIARGELIGALGLGSENPGAFGADHLDIAREVADQVAVALHQARLRAALEVERQRLEGLVEHIPEGVILLDGERRILLCNPAAQNVLPVLTEAAVGDVLTDLAGHAVAEILGPDHERPWHELEVAGPPYRLFEVEAQPMGSDAEKEGWVVLIRDVTQEREMQARVHRQERLAAVGQLAGGIAHDFNNLLSTIMLYAQMGRSDRDLPPDLTQSLDTILGEARQAVKLVQQILDFSRRSPIETHPVDLKPFIKEAVRILKRTIPESISLLLEVEAERYGAAFTVNADPTRIQQVLMNLVVNARDAMPEGGVLRIGLSRLEVGPGEEPPLVEMPSDSEWICLSVSDTGAGIPPEVMPHIFEPFFTTKERGLGTGLGLAQVYGIVTQHQGHVDVDTEMGEGTTFWVYLPAYGVEEEQVPREEAPAAVPRGQGETILLAEDNEGIREAARLTLESLGYRILTAADGQEALKIYQAQGEVDLLLTDVVMPEVGGRELVLELRKETPGLKVVAMTGHLLTEEMEALKEEGIQEVVHKPLDAAALAEAVRRVLDEG